MAQDSEHNGEAASASAGGASVNASGGGARGLPPTPDGQIRSGRLKGLTMWAAIWVLSWPILAESSLNALVGLVDTTLAAGVSEAAADAIGGASYIMWFLSLIGMAIGIGSTAMVSRAVGKGRLAVANAAVGQSLLLSLLAGVIVGFLVFFGAEPLAGLLQMEKGSEAREALAMYLRITSVGVPLIATLMTSLACCRAAGDSFRPLMTMVAVNAVNIGVSWALSGVDVVFARQGEDGEVIRHVLIANPFGLEMGIAGIAIGTLAAWITGTLIILVVLVRGSSGVRLRAKRLRPHWHTMRRLVKVGTPSFVDAVGMWFGNFLVLTLVGFLNAPGLLGAHIVAIRVEAFSFLPGFAMGMAAATLAGQYIGAGRPDLARQSMLRCMFIAIGLMQAFGIAFILVPELIVGIFSQQPTHLELTPQVLFIAGWVQTPFAIMMVLRSAIRGAGDTKWAMILTWVSTYGFRVPLAYFLSGVDIPLPAWAPWDVIVNPGPFDMGLVGLWYGLCIELVIRAALFLGRFFHGGWMHVKV